jgi:hypothetical protein
MYFAEGDKQRMVASAARPSMRKTTMARRLRPPTCTQHAKAAGAEQLHADAEHQPRRSQISDR